MEKKGKQIILNCEKLERRFALLQNGKEVTFCEVKSGYGHDAFLLEVDTLGRMVRDFLHYRQEAYTNE